ncbi:MAG TPA: helix-turn-helix transcriptional regulator [Rhodopila sp.]|jgi:DNA-binding XRE family transcriptional regulator|nr:helix-turn-helix transcriptional regulator [Rhodopila sp.]
MLMADETVRLTRDEYQDLVDARDHAIAMREIAAGAPTLTDAELDEFLASPTATAFFRRRAGLTQVELAGRVGVSQAYLAQVETGARTGSVSLYVKLARTLDVRVEDLVGE